MFIRLNYGVVENPNKKILRSDELVIVRINNKFERFTRPNEEIFFYLASVRRRIK